MQVNVGIFDAYDIRSIYQDQLGDEAGFASGRAFSAFIVDERTMSNRSSGTGPLLRLNLEAKSKALMKEKRDQVLGIIQA